MQSGRNCEQCAFVQRYTGQSSTNPKQWELLQCHKNPPMPGTDPYSGPGRWPVVRPDDWCGQYQTEVHPDGE